MPPQLYIVAGAPGSGKSRAFPPSYFEVPSFNADDRSAELNGGSYQSIPLEIRSRVNREFEAFIEDHIQRRSSFAFETTLRSSITFDQMASAARNGFEITMLYIGIEDPTINIERVANRSALGFHTAPTDLLLSIHARSHENLRIACKQAFAGIFRLILHDNTAFNEAPVPVMDIGDHQRIALREPLPNWVSRAIEEAGL